ncbi:MFS transporter [Rhodothermus profundi]|uniref:MFS transporter, UMF1 family n=1 Tax=Rhodothermus profundi TaxID=633813 RepID=A0A1M6P3F7_9BACT|nr:MFS transporter [Rhodothermus profundi]SHK02433.1 MFS transporter, UMF1 family [Rhodothermus profundi]
MNTGGYRPRVVWAWALYDFANSAFTTLVVTFVYAAFFTQAIAPDPVSGTALWSRAVTASGIIVALLSPYLGALADQGGYRKRFLLAVTVLCVLATAALYFPLPGQVMTALVLFTVANVAFELGNVFYNAFLPDLAPPHRIGRISGYGWALGYVGGLLCLVVALVAFIQPEVPLFGFSRDDYANVRATNLLVALWYGLFSLPLFFWVPEQRPAVRPAVRTIFQQATRQLVGTFREVRRYRQVMRLLLARLLYNDGLLTIFAFGGIYAAGTFGFEADELIVFGIVINVAAGLGAWLFGFVDDWLGGKRTLMLSLLGLSAACLLAVLTTSRTLFWIAALLIGICAGPNQSASRSLLGRFTPSRKCNEFYGFFAFSGKAIAFLGPLLLGLVTDWTGSQRVGVSTVLLFFGAGMVLLARVDETEGMQSAQETAPNGT